MILASLLGSSTEEKTALTAGIAAFTFMSLRNINKKRPDKRLQGILSPFGNAISMLGMSTLVGVGAAKVQTALSAAPARPGTSLRSSQPQPAIQSGGMDI